MAEAKSQAEDKTTTKTAPPAAAATAPIQSASQAQAAASDDEKAKAEEAAATELDAHPGKGLFVLYLGPSNIAAAVENDEFKDREPLSGEGTIAEVTSAQWAEVGLRTERTNPHVWDLSNDWRIPATDFSPEQVAYLLVSRTPGRPARFALVGADGKPVAS